MISQAIISEYHNLTDEIVQLKIRPEDQQFSWLAGQWVDFSCVIEGHEQVAGYSICSAAGSGSFELLVRRSRHPVSCWLHSADRSANSVLIQGGSGRCVYLPEQHEEVVCIAGGIGITPMISMLRTARQHQRQAILYHSVKHKDELLFAQEFSGGRFFVTSEGQRLDFAKIAQEHGLYAHYFLCGPRTLIDQANEQLTQLGVLHIHYERWW